MIRTLLKRAAFGGALSLAAMTTMTAPARAADPVLLHAAGSLRLALTEVIAAYEPIAGVKVQAKFGASGTLKDAIAKGERAEVFASANMEHPQALADAEARADRSCLFARNRLCALVRPGLAVTPATLLERMLDPAVKLAHIDTEGGPVRRLCLGGVSQGRQAQAGLVRDPGETRAAAHRRAVERGCRRRAAVAYGWHVAEGRADIFLTYCTNAMAAQAGESRPADRSLPDELAVGADYGMTVMADAPAAAYRFAMFILSPAGQKVLAKHGFSAPGLPQ